MSEGERSAPIEQPAAARVSHPPEALAATAPDASFTREGAARRLTPQAAIFLQRTAGNRSAARVARAQADPVAFRDSLAPGAPLEPSVRARFEGAFGLALRRCTTAEPAQTRISRQAQAATTTPPPAAAAPIDPAHPAWFGVIPWGDDKTKVYSVYGTTTGAPSVTYSDRTASELDAKQALEGKTPSNAHTAPPPPPATSGQPAPDPAQAAARQAAIDAACNAIDVARAQLPGWAFPERLPMTDQYGGKFVGPAGYVAATDVAAPKPIPPQKKGDKPTPVPPTAQQQTAMDSAREYRSFLTGIGRETADLTPPAAPGAPTPEAAAAYKDAQAKWFAKLESRLFFETSAKEGGTDSINVWDPQILTWGGGIGSTSGQASTTMFALAANKTVVDGRTVGDEVTKALHAAGIAFVSTNVAGRMDWAVVDTSTKRIFRDDDAAYLLKADPRLLMLLAHISRGELPGLAPAASVIQGSGPAPANVSPALQDAIRRAAYAVQQEYFLHRYAQAFEGQIRTLAGKDWPMQAIHVVLHLQWWGSAYGPLSKFDHWDKFPGYATFARDVITNHPNLKGLATSFGKATLITGEFASHMVEYFLDKKDDAWEEPTDPVTADDTADGEIYAEVKVGWPTKTKHRKLKSTSAGAAGATSSAAPAVSSGAPVLARRVNDGGPGAAPAPGLAHMSRALARAVLARDVVGASEPAPRATLWRTPRTPAATVTPAVPWDGWIDTPYNAALRRTPHKDPDAPYANIVADLPRATQVKVVGGERGWLNVEVDLDGRHLTGFVSHELVKPVVTMSEEIITAMSLAEAFVTLKRQETEKATTFGWKPSQDVQDEIDTAIGLLEATKRYSVDRSTLRVSFVAPPSGKIQISSIEDFILFVETVERAYPSASAKEVASEIRQVWFSDENWEVMLGSEGIPSVDIETEPDPIAKQFDMKDLDPKGSTKKINTPLGEVDIAHVMSGIDAALSGAPKAVADIGDRQLKFTTLRDADEGDPRDFATWSGDLGQAYAEYLVERFVNDKDSAELATFMADKSPPDQLLGDIHGYIAFEVWRRVPKAADPAGGALKVSSILRTLYLVDKRAGGAGSYGSYFETGSGKSAAEMRSFILKRALAFARVWYPPKMRAARNVVAGRYGFTKESILKAAMDEFDEKHKENEKKAAAKDKLGTVVDSFLTMLRGTVK